MVARLEQNGWFDRPRPDTGQCPLMRVRSTLILAALLALTVALPGPAAAAVLVEASGGSYGAPPTEPGLPLTEPGAQAADPGATAQATYSYSMYRPKTHTVQKTDWYCVPASIQMMLNLIKGTHSKGEAAQTMYWRYAQEHSTYPITDNGADAGGWVAALKHWGGGNYYVGIHSTMQASLRAAAKRMRATGKPVGMIVWGNHGGHAWVMTGFKSTADPKFTDSYTVTTVQAMGPLWPYGTIGGKSFDPGPREWVSYSELRNKFTENVQRNAPAWNGRWLTVLP
jgi:hypothetical protein